MRLAIFLLLATVIVACARVGDAVVGRALAAAESYPEPGRIVGATGDARFVRVPETIYVLNRRGLVSMTTDGKREDLVVADAVSAQPSPNRGLIAVRRNRGLTIVDASTGETRAHPLPDAGEPMSLGWDEEGKKLSIEVRLPASGADLGPPRYEKVWLDVGGEGAVGSTRSLDACAKGVRVEPERASPCAGLDVVGRTGERRALVRVEHCRETSHWGPPTGIGPTLLSGDCATVLFGFDDQVFVADVATAQVARLAAGELILPVERVAPP